VPTSLPRNSRCSHTCAWI